MNTGSYELPLFKPPLCKVADAESDVSTLYCSYVIIIKSHNYFTWRYVCDCTHGLYVHTAS